MESVGTWTQSCSPSLNRAYSDDVISYSDAIRIISECRDAGHFNDAGIIHMSEAFCVAEAPGFLIGQGQGALFRLFFGGICEAAPLSLFLVLNPSCDMRSVAWREVFPDFIEERGNIAQTSDGCPPAKTKSEASVQRKSLRACLHVSLWHHRIKGTSYWIAL